MSGSCKPKASCFGSDIHRMLLAAEAGQKADIKTYSSGHLGPRSLIQSQPQKEKKQAFWGMSQCREENPNPLTVQQTQRTKTDYDLYVNHLMASQSSLHDTLLNASLRELGNGKEREMELEDAEKEVCRLEQEARGALEENKRARNELQNVPATLSPEDSIMKNTSLSGLQDVGNAIGHTSSIQAKRLQVSNTGREIRQLEEEIRERLVSTATTTATERHIKDLKTEIMRLIASNERLKSINKAREFDLYPSISSFLKHYKCMSCYVIVGLAFFL
ncbi:uncharacterized protein C6orf118-like [Chaetodon trifascialis]|uniref:uncharacterized protein C6orf118-like n=1 Tax=Chaetodon trifascialis TaxID=109706 RepID=UPI00399159BE